jgi:hypothetical protein
MLPPPLTAEWANPLDWAGWDAEIARLPGGGFFHGAAWARVLNATYGFQPCYLVVRSGGHLDAVLPLMELNSLLAGRRGVSLPFTDRCAPLAPSPEIATFLIRAALGHARARRWGYCEFRGGRVGRPASIAYYGHTLDLTPGARELWEHTASSTRRAVRKAERHGVRIEFSQSLESIRTLHALLCRTRHRKGLPPQPRRFFEEIARHVLRTNQGCVALAWHERQPVAGALFFQFCDRGLFKFGGSDERMQHLRANNLLFWRAIEWHIARGYKSLDLGRTSLANPGLRRFKSSWGAAEDLIEYVRYDLRREQFTRTRDLSLGWHTAILRVLPQWVSRLLGTALYKHLA